MGSNSKVRKVVVSAAVLLGVVAVAASGESEKAESGDNGQPVSGVSKGLGSSDASADVSTPEWVREGTDAFGLVYGQVVIKNNSSKRSDYFVTVVAESPDGSIRHDETMVHVMGLESGQSATEKGIFTKDIPVDAILRTLEVQRTAST
jgi:hypothetical protein